jgi:hypothetical protein
LRTFPAAGGLPIVRRTFEVVGEVLEEAQMARFLVTYHGGGTPSDPEQAARARAAFGEWVSRAGQAIVDPGAPLRIATQVPNGSPQPEITIAGYSVIEASSVEAAVEVLKSHPFVARGGTLQLHQAVSA